MIDCLKLRIPSYLSAFSRGAFKSLIFPSINLSIASLSSWLTLISGISRLALPHSATNSSCNLTISLMASWPNSITARKSSSLIKLASPSTITIESFVPEIIMDKSLSSISVFVGLILSSPFTLPTFIEATGPSHGISEIAKLAEAPIVPKISPLFSPSKDNTVIKT